MGRPHRFTGGRVRLCAAAVAVLSVAACSGKSPSDGPSGPTGKQYSLEQIATQTACTMQLQNNVAEFRQGTCKTTQGRFTVLTFATQKAGDEWLAEAKNWGGNYLVGPRWVVVGTPQQLQTFRAKLGGTIQAGDDHSGGHPHATPS